MDIWIRAIQGEFDTTASSHDSEPPEELRRQTAVDRPKRIYKFITQLPKDYCLIPGNCTIKLVETKNLLELIIFNFGFGLIYCKCTGRQVIKWI